LLQAHGSNAQHTALKTTSFIRFMNHFLSFAPLISPQ